MSAQAWRRLRWLLFVALACAAAYWGLPYALGQFRVGGTITLAAHLRHRIPRTNAVLFIVAKNRGGVALAVRRIVNPQFPIYYILDSADLIVPGSRPKGPFKIVVQMNTHGNVGAPRKGDFEGECPDLVHPGERYAHVVLDTELKEDPPRPADSPPPPVKKAAAPKPKPAAPAPPAPAAVSVSTPTPASFKPIVVPEPAIAPASVEP